MAKSLLYNLNGERQGAFRAFLDGFAGEPRLLWYPSAGEDFRDLLYFSRAYRLANPIPVSEPEPPDLFLHTDYFPCSGSTFLDSPLLYQDNRTCIRARTVEELPRLDLPLDGKLAIFRDGNHLTGRVFFLEITVESRLLGSFSCPLLYAFVENAAFFGEKILPFRGRFSHLVHINFGSSFGGGSCSGSWLWSALATLSCEVFVTEQADNEHSGDRWVLEKYPQLRRQRHTCQLEPIREIRRGYWRRYGETQWSVVRQMDDGERRVFLRA